jgi:cell cycle arrest protein BUB2
MKLLRTLPPLQARQCVMLACQFVPELPSELYDALARHAWDTELVLDP